MANHQEPAVPDQPVKKLIISVSLLLVACALILVLQILPARYGVDPTGFGTYVGLMKRYETQQYYEGLKNTTEKKEQVTIEVAPGEELEFKVYVLEGDPLVYPAVVRESEDAPARLWSVSCVPCAESRETVRSPMYECVMSTLTRR